MKNFILILITQAVYSAKILLLKMNLVCAYILLLKSVSVKITNLFHATGLFLYPPENIRKPEFFWCFRGYRKGIVAWNGSSNSHDAFRKFFCKNSHFLVNPFQADFPFLYPLKMSWGIEKEHWPEMG